MDAEDRTWQDLSAEPYDSPLSYGGWTQTRALGARIASIVCTRELSLQHDDSRPNSGSTEHPRRPGSSGTSLQKRRKQKIIIHSSPFLRCIQSSIAISAGISQFLGNQAKPQVAAQPRYPRNRLFSPARSQSLEQRGGDIRSGSAGRKGSITELNEAGADFTPLISLDKPLLRVDAWLGEWLSPSYYEFITPPPPSEVMLAGAMADLSKSAETIQGATLASESASINQSDAEQDLLEGTGATTLSLVDLARVLPELSSDEAPRFRDSFATGSSRRTRSDSSSEVAHGGYSPPVPTYALSITEPIPAGFVAHARDACLDIDHTWDSTGEPQNWGDGGEFGEEWSSMHVRFRSGLANLVSWYKDHGVQNASQTETDTGDDGEEDVILVIVTHSAGCNALIGGLTNQPVLLEVGMGSLTMAVHKEAPTLIPHPSPRHRRTSSSSSSSVKRSSIALAVHEEYDMKLTASTEHLKPGAELFRMPTMSSATMSSIAEHSELDKPRRNSALGSIRRRPASNSISTQVKSPPSLTSGFGTPTSTTGLWGGRKGSIGVEILEEEEPSPGQSSVMNLPDSRLESPVELPEDAISPMEGGAPLPQPVLGRSGSQKGLWGGGGGGGGGGVATRGSSQRRWTLSERTNSIGQ